MYKFLLLTVVVCQVANFELATAASRPAGSASTYPKSTLLFGKKSFEEINRFQVGNVVYSPWSASMVLTMAYFGAKGETRRQLRQALALPHDDVQVGREIRDITNLQNSPGGYELHPANRIFYNEDHVKSNSFVNLTRTVFRASPRKIDFTDPNDATETINEWCASKTDQHIKGIVKPSDIGENTNLLLINAVYFKGNWLTPFESRHTAPRDFHVYGDIKATQVPTMATVGDNFRWGDIDGVEAKFAELPYVSAPGTQPGDAVSMIIILPSAVDGLPDLVKNFHTINLRSLLNVEPRPMTLVMPKFKFKTTFRLRSVLHAMGVSDMFTERADLSYMTRGSSLIVSDVIQKSVIEVHESGTVYGPYTRPVISTKRASYRFKVKHPFLAVIMKKDGTLLFTAAVYDPTDHETTTF